MLDKRKWLGAAIVISLTILVGEAGTATADQAVFDVRSFGATGTSSANDAPAIDSAISAANHAGGGIVQFRAGTYLAAGTATSTTPCSTATRWTTSASSARAPSTAAAI